MKKLIFFFIFVLVLFSGCQQQIPTDAGENNVGSHAKETGAIEEALEKCKTGDYSQERDCYTALAYNNLDVTICEKMPEDENKRQANKALCFGFMASATGDLAICRNQKIPYYANLCEIAYQRWLMGQPLEGLKEFEELREKYQTLK